ncbi:MULTISPECIES: TIGR00267 family protein [unclassified Archaeoglobus]|uniref:TIGR00267 family protein n=2 Tax=Archaeoglobus TaxID=2233 RepID=UPI0025B811EA|nr:MULTISPECIES: TIGR00267 family protein [unclassified Archaeoglobus]
MERQVVRGFIDGALSVLGVVIGASNAEISIVISAGIGGGIANAISNAFGAFSAEMVEEEIKLSEVEKSMLLDLRKTEIYKEIRKKVMLRGIIDGTSTAFGSFLPVFPFILSLIVGYSVNLALALSVGLTATSLFIIGVYYGIVSKRNILISGAKMGLMGVVTAIATFAIERGLRLI